METGSKVINKDKRCSCHVCNVITTDGLTSGVVTPGIGEPAGDPDGSQHSCRSLISGRMSDWVTGKRVKQRVRMSDSVTGSELSNREDAESLSQHQWGVAYTSMCCRWLCKEDRSMQHMLSMIIQRTWYATPTWFTYYQKITLVINLSLEAFIYQYSHRDKVNSALCVSWKKNADQLGSSMQ